jgi:hypothetical protein
MSALIDLLDGVVALDHNGAIAGKQRQPLAEGVDKRRLRGGALDFSTHGAVLTPPPRRDTRRSRGSSSSSASSLPPDLTILARRQHMHDVRHDVVEQALVVGDDDHAALGRAQRVDAVGDDRCSASMSRPESVSSSTQSRGSSTAICRISARFFSPPEKPTLTGRLSMSCEMSSF